MRNSFQWCDKRIDFNLSLNDREMYVMNREFMLNQYHERELWIYLVIIIIIDFEIKLFIMKILFTRIIYITINIKDFLIERLWYSSIKKMLSIKIMYIIIDIKNFLIERLWYSFIEKL